MNKTGLRTAAVEEGLFVDDSLWVWAIRKTKEEFMLHFNKLEMPFGDVQTFTRSGKTIGLGGIADVLAAAASEWDAAAGTMNSQGGDTYVQLVRFTKEGLPQIESLMAGGNSDRPDSPHFNDQMDLLENHKTKPMTLDKAEVLKNAVKTYYPE
ncbi:MAG: acyl-homoserine-lactone acylase [Bacteroidia bacterium]|jgi:acyl-homoserine-lactone acylase